MPRIARELGPLEIKRLTESGYHPVGHVPGLHLQVTPSGTRSWVLRVTVGQKRREVGLGAMAPTGSTHTSTATYFCSPTATSPA